MGQGQSLWNTKTELVSRQIKYIQDIDIGLQDNSDAILVLFFWNHIVLISFEVVYDLWHRRFFLGRETLLMYIVAVSQKSFTNWVTASTVEGLFLN